MGRGRTAETEQRIQNLVVMIASGSRRSDCLANAAQQWGLGERQGRRLIGLARDALLAEWSIDRSDFLVELLSQLMTVQRQAMASGNLGVALAAITAKARLAGLLR